MREPIDITKDTWFFDDRAKSRDLLKVDAVLWSDHAHALCRVVKVRSDSSRAFNLAANEFEPFLVELGDGEVLNSQFDSWYATNDISTLL